MTTDLSRRLGKIWNLVKILVLSSPKENVRNKIDEWEENFSNWENFEDLPNDLQKIILHIEKK